MPQLILITGGARSGKSRFATELASRMSFTVTFIATASFSEDSEMKERIRSHQKSRPSHWDTIEEPRNIASLIPKIHSPERVVLIDCLTLFISNLLLDDKDENEILDQVQAIANLSKKFNKATIVVTNEVGWGVVPTTPLGRKFRDIAGKANQILAKEADFVWLLVCGIPLKVK